ncbi:MAG: sigma-E processing peptidase SpoIIGA [Oscillospiraceae bacterium]|nr:sigma-E processing peptidase SpoIIGA [Oscillospiraceae bacterium]
MSIYLDTLVIVNAYITWLTLSLTSKLSHQYSPPIRMAIGAFLGGFSALIIIIPENMGVIFLKIISFVIIIVAAFVRKGLSRQRFLIICAEFLGVNIVFGGAVYLLQSLMGADIIYINNASFYFDISLGTLIFFTAVIYVLTVIISGLLERKADRNHAYRAMFDYGGTSYSFDGVADTGNTVTDLFTGKPVIICTGSNEKPDFERFSAVPYSTIDGEGLLYAFSPDELYIEDETGKKKTVNALLAFTERGERRAVFNPAILHE